MEKHPLTLIQSYEDRIAIIIANHLKMLGPSVGNYLDLDTDDILCEHSGTQWEIEVDNAEKEMVKRIAICLHLVNELLLATMLVKLYHLSENSAYEYIAEAKEVMDKHYPRD